jgi:hypothetical protein
MSLIKMEATRHSYRIILVQTYLGKWPLGQHWWRGKTVLTDSWKYWLCRLTELWWITPGMWHYHLACSSKDFFTMNRKVLWSFEVWGITQSMPVLHSLSEFNLHCHCCENMKSFPIIRFSVGLSARVNLPHKGQELVKLNLLCVKIHSVTVISNVLYITGLAYENFCFFCCGLRRIWIHLIIWI